MRDYYFANLDAARGILEHILPGHLPRIRGLDYHGECRAAGAVGRDFFDFPSPSEQGLGVAVGDLSALGAGSAIMLSGMQALLRGLTSHGCGDISGMVEELNRALHRTSPGDFYATLFYAHVDPVRRELHYVNAGHEPALLIRQAGRVYQLGSTGTVLGLTSRSAYGRRTVPLEPGDVLVAYTDGVAEAADAEGREFGSHGVLRVVRGHPFAKAADLARGILTAADRFTADSVPADDRTVAVVRFTGEAGKDLLESEACELTAA